MEKELTAEALYERGLAYADKGDYDRAIEELEARLQIDPNNAEIREELNKLKAFKEKMQKQ